MFTLIESKHWESLGRFGKVGIFLQPEIMKDPVAKFHFNNIDAQQRKKWLEEVDPEFLNKSVELYKEYWKTKEEV